MATRAQDRQAGFDAYDKSRAAPDSEQPAPASPKPTARRPEGRGAGVPPLVTWTLVTVGIWLVYASIRGLSPLAELKAALGGKGSPGQAYTLPPLLAQLGATVDDGTTAPPFSSRAGSVAAAEQADPSKFVSSDGGPTLTKGALAAFLAWQKAYGAPIICNGPGDSWRSYADQQKAHAEDPDRFASADKSFHVKGLAVDVHLDAMKAAVGTANWTKLYAAAVATGWCNPRGPYKGDHKEPWHFSFGGCG